MSTLPVDLEGREAGTSEKGWGGRAVTLQTWYSGYLVHINLLNLHINFVTEGIIPILILQVRKLPREGKYLFNVTQTVSSKVKI